MGIETFEASCNGGESIEGGVETVIGRGAVIGDTKGVEGIGVVTKGVGGTGEDGGE
jgi:hypothetical protein